MAVVSTLRPGLPGTGGVHRTGDQLVLSESNGTLVMLDLDSAVLVQIGVGWTAPADVVVDAAAVFAYVSDGGSVVQVPLAAADRANGIKLLSGLTSARQLALDDGAGVLYVVDSAATGALVAIDLATGTSGPVTTGLTFPQGVAVEPGSAAWVTEQTGGGGRLTRVDLIDGTTTVVLDPLVAPFYLSWTDDRRLLLADGAAAGTLLRVDPSTTPAGVDTVVVGLPAGAVHGLPLSPSSFVLRCEGEVLLVVDDRPVLADVSATSGFGGTVLELTGQNFGPLREDNHVEVGGVAALVFEADPGHLSVLTDPASTTGPVTVTTAAGTARSAADFVVRAYPGGGEDGPPVVATGQGDGDLKVLASTGTLRVLVCLVYPRDTVPADLGGARNAVVSRWSSVHDYYDQASFSKLDVAATVTGSWHELSGNAADYVDLVTSQNVTEAGKPRLVAEAAQAAVDEGVSLGDFDVIVPLIWLDGAFIRAWGGVFQQTFAFHGTDTGGTDVNINLTAPHDLAVIWIGDDADWGRHAHELGHALVSSPLSGVLGEDIYQSDLVDPSDATAQHFDLMGKHDEHPLFSGYHLEKLGWYTAIQSRQWDRNSTSIPFTLAAHGGSVTPAGGAAHLVKITVAAGLTYYIEARSRTGLPGQVFDGQIPVASDGATSGVIVTKVVSGEVNNNQEMRFITLLHDEKLMAVGESAVDPARALTIRLDSVTSTPGNPATCAVTVTWAQGIADDPNGAFDLSIEPWDTSVYQTPDIWVDRDPFGSFDEGLDSQGRPKGTGDKPKVDAINQLFARIHVSGTIGATNVPVTFYAVSPPGVGDNGDWTPLRTVIVPAIAQNSFADVPTNWVPTLDKHTCLKVFAGQQLGEVSGANNSAQENVVHFEAASSSVPAAITMPFAVRNPQPVRRAVFVSLAGVPRGYTAQIPHAWVWLDGHEARELELKIIATEDFPFYREHRRATASVRIGGYVERTYDTEAAAQAGPAGSRVLGIGGVLALVTPKKRGGIELDRDVRRGERGEVWVDGRIDPPLAGERVTVRAVDDQGSRFSVRVTTVTDGAFSAAVATDGQWRELTLVASVEASPTVVETDSEAVLLRR